MTQPSPRRFHPEAMQITRWLAADGWPHRAFAMPAEGLERGEIVFLGGRGDFFEKYLEAIAHWSSQGWHVRGFDWRGQGGSGTTHPGKYCHVADFAQLVDDLAGFCVSLPPPTGARVLVGHSMGGHILLRALAERRVAPAGAVLLSPMLGIRAGRLGARSVNALAGIGRLPPLAHRPIWDGAPRSNPGHLTACPDRHADKLWWKAQTPEIARGGPTWLWLAAAARSMRLVEQNLRRSPLAVPCLALTGARDRVVDNRAVRRIVGHMMATRLSEIPSGGHELLRESDAARLMTFQEIDDFLARIAKTAPCGES
ncbi:alpha/beta fold hydrolase [Erythrobacter sp. EC-HK427]|uniref:alpha/beta fold hydrolase n=1 Tax=Erythrobacter sp. EC-HK427 TaxID=2038396 RepID=UPI00125C039A|nr:alpha/beta hydrolase [Erythrobacter sp. EC-HK427]VVT20783.1 Lysophospholipase [Erythrobacter sp. EC-HK427]